jgi:predicted RND superfamily exporter protein
MQSLLDSFEVGFGKWVVKHRWWIVAATIPITLIAASGIRFLTFNRDLRVFFGEKNPHLQALQALENTYTKDNNIFYIIAPRDGNVFTREALAAVQELTETSWQMPYSNRVDSITNFQHTRGKEDELVVENLVDDPSALSDADLERIRQIALSEPMLVNRLISSSGHVTAVNVNVIKPGKSLQEVPKIAGFAHELADRLRDKYPNIDIYITGAIMFDYSFGKASMDDAMTLVPLMFITLIVIIGLALRSLMGTLATLIIILVSMLSGMGLAGWFGVSLDPASANAPVVILTLAVADSVHILAMLFKQMRLGKSKHEAIAESLRINFQAVFLTSATTAVGFLSMNSSEAPPFRYLGNIVAVGVMVAFAYSILFLPSLLAILPIRIKPKPDRWRPRGCEWLADFVIKRRDLVFWCTVLTVAILATGISRIELNDDFIKYFDRRYHIRQATDFMQDNLTGANIIEYSLESGESGGISNPEYLATVEAFANWYRTQPRVDHVSSITDIMKRLNKSMHGDDESYYKIPQQRDLAAQYLLLYELSLPFGLDLNNRINVDKSATRMTVVLNDVTTRELRTTDEKARQWLKANAPASMLTYGTGISMIWAHITHRNIDSMLGATIVALALISGMLIFAIRSLKLGLLSLIPNLVPTIMALGLWGFISGRIGLALSIIVSATIGIVVDDTVHFLSKYLRGRRDYGMSSTEAVRYSFSTVGTAMWVTTVALVAGFSILCFSGYKVNSDMGLMAAITIAFALTMDFLLLPTLLMKAEGKADKLTTD